jgi:hypothetical protein
LKIGCIHVKAIREIAVDEIESLPFVGGCPLEERSMNCIFIRARWRGDDSISSLQLFNTWRVAEFFGKGKFLLAFLASFGISRRPLATVCILEIVEEGSWREAETS